MCHIRSGGAAPRARPSCATRKSHRPCCRGCQCRTAKHDASFGQTHHGMAAHTGHTADRPSVLCLALTCSTSALQSRWRAVVALAGQSGQSKVDRFGPAAPSAAAASACSSGEASEKVGACSQVGTTFRGRTSAAGPAPAMMRPLCSADLVAAAAAATCAHLAVCARALASFTRTPHEHVTDVASSRAASPLALDSAESGARHTGHVAAAGALRS